MLDFPMLADAGHCVVGFYKDFQISSFVKSFELVINGTTRLSRI